MVRASLWLIAVFLLVTAAGSGSAHALESSSPQAVAMARPALIEERQVLSPKMNLDEAIQKFNATYRARQADARFRALDMSGAQAVMMDLSTLNAKLFAASKTARGSLDRFDLPVPLSRQKFERWKQALSGAIRPPEVAYQTFVVSLNGKAYVVAPGHGVKGDKRYHTPRKSDAAVRPASPEEARYAISLDRRPAASPARIVTLQGKLPTGEAVRFEAGDLRGADLLQVLLPDERRSFHNATRSVEVDYGRTEIFVLPAEWSAPNRLKLHRASGFSGAPAIEKTPDGDVVVGHFIGHHVVKIGKSRVTIGILEDYDAIRASIESLESHSVKGIKHEVASTSRGKFAPQ